MGSSNCHDTAKTNVFNPVAKKTVRSALASPQRRRGVAAKPLGPEACGIIQLPVYACVSFTHWGIRRGRIGPLVRAR